MFSPPGPTKHAYCATEHAHATEHAYSLFREKGESSVAPSESLWTLQLQSSRVVFSNSMYFPLFLLLAVTKTYTTCRLRQVIMGYKCVHESCQKSFESRKGYNVHRQKNSGKQCRCHGAKTSSSGAKSFSAAWQIIISAERPKLHLQPIVDAMHQGPYHPDL